MAHKMALVSETLTGTRTLTTVEAKRTWAWHLDPGGADRTLVMASESACTGHTIWVTNTADALECIDVKASDTTTVVGRIVQGDSCDIVCDGTSWRMRDRRRECVLGETLAAGRVLTAAEVVANPIVAFDPGGLSRTVDLPATTSLAGVSFKIINTADAAETLTVRLTGGGATVATVDQNEHAFLTCYSATAGSWVGAVSKAT